MEAPLRPSRPPGTSANPRSIAVIAAFASPTSYSRAIPLHRWMEFSRYAHTTLGDGGEGELM